MSLLFLFESTGQQAFTSNKIIKIFTYLLPYFINAWHLLSLVAILTFTVSLCEVWNREIFRAALTVPNPLYFLVPGLAPADGKIQNWMWEPQSVWVLILPAIQKKGESSGHFQFNFELK